MSTNIKRQRLANDLNLRPHTEEMIISFAGLFSVLYEHADIDDVADEMDLKFGAQACGIGIMLTKPLADNDEFRAIHLDFERLSNILHGRIAELEEPES